MKARYDYVVVGGGFRSIIAAYSLAKSGHKILLLESGKKVGGFMSPIKWDEFWIDKGPQFFDNIEPIDRDLLDEILGQGLLKDIGFKYSSFIDGKKTDGFAIPDWRHKGKDFASSAFSELILKNMAKGLDGIGLNNKNHTLEDLIIDESGDLLGTEVVKLTHKFYRKNANEISDSAACMSTLFGRKLLFDHDLSVNLKKSPIIDNFLAAQKMSVNENRFNLYPKGENLEKVRLALENSLVRANVDVHTETTLANIDHKNKKLELSIDKEISFKKIFFGCDVRETEMILNKTETINDSTHLLPMIFHCYVVKRDCVDDSYYTVNYELDHLSTRITKFCNYMGHEDSEYGVVCAEQPIDKNSQEWQNPEKDQEIVFKEIQSIGVVNASSFLKAKSFKIPVTYKIPLKGIEEKVDNFYNNARSSFGESIVIPDAYTLTRKNTLDDLRQLKII